MTSTDTILLKSSFRKSQKYKRRIKNFYRSIHEPTLFFRYISDQDRDENGRSTELTWIENHKLEIETLIQSYNPNNRIFYIANTMGG